MIQDKALFISIVIPTYNSEKTLSFCLESVRRQNYSKSKTELLVVDGGSDDSTISIAKKFKAKIIHASPLKQNAEYNKYLGFKKSKGDLVLMLDSDNVLPHKDWMQNMATPFKSEPLLVGTDTTHIHYEKTLSLIDRYLALFGSLDPVAFYLGKSDKMPLFDDKYSFFKKTLKKNRYLLINFDLKSLPAIGSNGFLMDRKIILNNAKIDEKHFMHTDIHADVISKGFNKYAFVRTDITHLTGVRSIKKFIFRRIEFLEQNLKRSKYRRHGVYMPQDRIKLVIYIIYSLTFIKPFYDSFRGYVKLRDSAWFLHPFLCFVFLSIYGYVVIKMTIKRIF